MKIIKKNQPVKYLFFLGLFLLAVGLTSGIVAETWGIIPLIFLIAGTITLTLWIVLQTQQNQWWNSRSTQAGANALIAIVAVFAIVGLLNFLGTRYYLRQDLTETQLFSLAPQSQELVRRLEKPVKIWVFDVNRNPLDKELLENYRRESSKFEFEYVDPQARPTLANKFGVQDYGEVYLESGDNRQLVQKLNINERLSEIRLTNRLQQVNSTTTTPVYFVQGHGEHSLTSGQGGISQAIQGLSNINYSGSPLNLGEKSQVPEDVSVVVVAGPKRELFDSEVKALQDYLNGGGNVLLMIDPNTKTNFDSLLKEWGVILDNRLAVDVSGSAVGLGPAVPIVTDYGQHPITQEFGNGISFYRLARPLEINPVAGIKSTILLQTKPYPDSWAESDQESEKLEFNPETDIPGPLTLGVALTKTIPTTPTEGEEKPPARTMESRLVVIGDSEFATDGLFEQQLNGDVFLNSVTWLSQQDQQPLSIRPKEPRNRRINLSVLQTTLLALSSLLLLPLLGLVTAAIIWWKRR